MPLRVELKPFERIIIGQSLITNSETRTTFLIDGEAPILRAISRTWPVVSGFLKNSSRMRSRTRDRPKIDMYVKP